MQRVSVSASEAGDWEITDIRAIRGESLPNARSLTRAEGPAFVPRSPGDAWMLYGVRSHERYSTREEKEQLARTSPPLGRPQCRCAALIPITKSERWWALAQDERREILGEASQHIAMGREYLPAIARRLYHARELGEPFDFLTWFEFDEVDTGRFEELLARLRATTEWSYIDREVDLRLRSRATSHG